jgi:hypothetical protein
MRGASVSSSPLPAKTSYFSVDVSTRMVCTVLSSYRSRWRLGSRPEFLV